MSSGVTFSVDYGVKVGISLDGDRAANDRASQIRQRPKQPCPGPGRARTTPAAQVPPPLCGHSVHDRPRQRSGHGLPGACRRVAAQLRPATAARDLGTSAVPSGRDRKPVRGLAHAGVSVLGSRRPPGAYPALRLGAVRCPRRTELQRGDRRRSGGLAGHRDRWQLGAAGFDEDRVPGSARYRYDRVLALGRRGSVSPGGRRPAGRYRGAVRHLPDVPGGSDLRRRPLRAPIPPWKRVR